MEDKKIKNQNVIIENREKIFITGVVDVHSFDDEVVIVQTELGILTIKGTNLKLNKLSLDNSDLAIDGNVIAIAYSDVEQIKSGGMFKKLFK